MSIKKYRSDLKSLFNKNVVPDSKSFEALIDSVVVKRDDKFFGKWEPGVGYADGDVVFHNNSLYYFVKTAETNADCDCDDCGNSAPKPKSCCWKLLQINNDDGDWLTNRTDTDLVVKKLYTPDSTETVGIGTGANAAAFFHINDNRTGGGGQLMFNPHQITEGGHLPILRMENLALTPSEACMDGAVLENQYVSESLDERKVVFDTNTEGYVFRKKATPIVQTNEAGEAEETANALALPNKLLYVTAVKNQPRVGIGNVEPDASLDISGKNGQILLDAGEENDPDLTIINTNQDEATYLSETVSVKTAAFVTNTSDGFVFKIDSRIAERREKHGRDRTNSGKPLMVVQPDEKIKVKIGIGTENPTTELEAEGLEGKVQFSLHDYNPSVNVINKVKKDDTIIDGSYLAVGVAGKVNDEKAVLSTNSQKGFILQQANASSAKVGVNVGEEFLCLKPEPVSKGLFMMLMKGRIAAHGFYTLAAPKDAKALSNKRALELVCKLEPTEYTLSNETEKQYGFSDLIHNDLSNLVRKFEGLDNLNGNGNAIANHSIVAMLVGAVKELTATVNKLEDEINTLKNRRHY